MRAAHAGIFVRHVSGSTNVVFDLIQADISFNIYNQTLVSGNTTVFVGIGNSVTNSSTIYISTTSGVSWQPGFTFPVLGYVLDEFVTANIDTSIATNGPQLLISNGVGNTIVTSDGQSWTTGTNSTLNSAISYQYLGGTGTYSEGTNALSSAGGNGVWVQTYTIYNDATTPQYTTRISTSTDGVSWTLSQVFNGFESVTMHTSFDGSKFIAFIHDYDLGISKIYTSTTGALWTLTCSDMSGGTGASFYYDNSVVDMLYNGLVYVVFSLFGIYYSTDLVTWTKATDMDSVGVLGGAVVGSTFVVSDYFGGAVYSSTDGNNWTLRPTYEGTGETGSGYYWSGGFVNTAYGSSDKYILWNWFETFNNYGFLKISPE